MCDHHKKQNRPGAALKNGKAHQLDHINYSRRTFIHNLGVIGGVSLFLNKIPLTTLSANPLTQMLEGADSDRILVLIRLKGGNDGLNTIIPIFDYGTYQQNRPTIAIPQNLITKLDDAYGVPNYMEGIVKKWNEGQMKVVHSVGYPEQNLSHFRSSDIWASGSDADTIDTSGWLGRYLNNEFPDYINNPPIHPPAVQIGGAGNLIFNNQGATNMGMVVNDPEQLAEIALNGELYDVNNVPDCFKGEQLSFLRTIANSTFQYAEVISETYNKAINEVEYTASELGRQLAVVARLIKGGLSTNLYMVSLDGFDTHAGQNNIHPYLMTVLSQAIDEFYQDLSKSDDDARVLSMTFSEFGRRIEQNASNGTDHGAAAPLMLFGPALEGNGLIGQGPDLKDVDEVGNLKFHTDFRQIYATILENWLCIDGDLVDNLMGQSFDRIQNLGIQACNISTSTRDQWAKTVRHWSYYDGNSMQIAYQLPSAATVKVIVFNLLGQPIKQFSSVYQSAGEHRVQFAPNVVGMSAGQYVYSIQIDRVQVSGKFSFVPY